MEFNIGFETEFSSEHSIERLSDKFIRAGIDVGRVNRDAHGRRAYTNWFFVGDNSIRPPPGYYGYELVSPIMDYNEGLDTMQKLFSILKATNANTNSSTGFHVGLSFKDPALLKKMDILKLIVLLNEDKVLADFSRTGNRYCRSHMVDLKKAIKDEAANFAGFLSSRADLTIENLISNPTDLKKYIQTRDKYRTVNFIKMERSYLEFRGMGGESYHLAFDKIKSTVDHFRETMIAAVSESSDGRFKREVAKIMRTYYRTVSKNINQMIDKNKESKAKLILDLEAAQQRTDRADTLLSI